VALSLGNAAAVAAGAEVGGLEYAGFQLRGEVESRLRGCRLDEQSTAVAGLCT